MKADQRRERIRFEGGTRLFRRGRVTRVQHSIRQLKGPAADRTSEGTCPNRPSLHEIRQQHEKTLVVLVRTAQMVSELDEHGGGER
jgi:hypothetical protein